MSSTLPPTDQPQASSAPDAAATPAGFSNPILRFGHSVLKLVASAKLTVSMFVLSMVLVLVGTLAQDKMGIWDVMASYFRSWIALVEVESFFPRAWFPDIVDKAMRIWTAGFLFVIGLAVASAGLFPKARGWRWSALTWGIALLASATAAQGLVLGRFVFPGGALIGAVLCANLLAAFLVRFPLKARGLRLLAGLLVLAAGAYVTWFVIDSGHNKEGLQAVPDFAWTTLWLWCKAGLSALTVTCAVGFVLVFGRKDRERLVETWLLGVSAVLLAPLSVWLWMAGDSAYLGDAGMRVLWQLIQATAAGVILLVGCNLLYRRLGGLVLIHIGLALVMASEWYVSRYAVEERMTIREGETSNYAQDTRDTELAIAAAAADNEEDVIAVPRSRLVRSAQTGQAIAAEGLPFDLRVVQYWKNSDIREFRTGQENLATAGHGLVYAAHEVESERGTGSSRVDVASAYVEVLEKGRDRKLGTYLFSQYLTQGGFLERITADGKTYEVSLRFKRSTKPFSIRVLDVRKDDYIGTSTPRNYSSDIEVIDPAHETPRKIRISMNNPLRYAGLTFYQSDYSRDPQTGVEVTTFQVVTNTGWMIPYVACMVVATGMLAHFWCVLLWFLRQSAEKLTADADKVVLAAVDGNGDGGRRRKRERAAAEPARSQPWLPKAMVILVAGACALWAVGRARPPKLPESGFDFAAFGALPVVHKGRIKPLDTLARNTLRSLSDRSYYMESSDGAKKSQKQPAVKWLLDVVAKPEAAGAHPVFRIYNLEVLETLGLKPRQGYRFSMDEIRGTAEEPREQLKAFIKQVEEAQKRDTAKLSFYERKVLEAMERLHAYLEFQRAFESLDFANFVKDEDLQKSPDATVERALRLAAMAMETDRELRRKEAPLIVPLAEPGAKEEPWMPYGTARNKLSVQNTLAGLSKRLPAQVSAENRALVQRLAGDPQATNPAAALLESIFTAYADNKPDKFNEQVAAYRQWLDEHQPQSWHGRQVAFEAYFNHFDPFYLATLLYVCAFLATTIGWAGVPGGARGWSETCRRIAFWVVVVAVCLHTFGLLGRVYISGRPPVTNLYSSAVFIAWAAVLLGLVIEAVWKLTLGNVVAAVSGAAVLAIADFLASRGDTFTVMQAVLDTQFWLATHVVFISLGYSAMYVAGLLGIAFILGAAFTSGLSDELRRTLTRLTYGIICFAMFFSFVGTVLGGLWADDTWGRFWGWDPKENGALLIVLWIAIILHARWDEMVRDRGLAVLAVGGNIVTTWSWFGVNELGVGLHSYGFTEGALPVMAAFVASQLVIIALALLPPGALRLLRRRTVLTRMLGG